MVSGSEEAVGIATILFTSAALLGLYYLILTKRFLGKNPYVVAPHAPESAQATSATGAAWRAAGLADDAAATVDARLGIARGLAFRRLFLRVLPVAAVAAVFYSGVLFGDANGATAGGSGRVSLANFGDREAFASPRHERRFHERVAWITLVAVLAREGQGLFPSI